MIKISKRLEAISSLVPKQSSVIDIGCDHGLLDIYLYQNSRYLKVIATDINEKALNNAKENIKKFHLENKIETRLGNGLDTIDDQDNIDTVIIAGMGVHTIVGILKNNLDKLKKINTIIIQSNTKIDFLRKEMIKLKFFIEDEKLVEDNKKIYTIIKFKKGKKRYTKEELYFGPILMKENNNLFKKQNKKELDKLYLLLKLIPKNKIINKIKIKKKIKMYEKL